MEIAKREQIWDYITKLINHADEEFLKRTDNKSKLIEGLSNELFFIGAYTRADLDSQVIPFMEENTEDICSMKELVLKKFAAKKTVKETVKRKSVKSLWTKAEINTLKKEYPKTDTKKLAKKLKRTLEAVRFQAKKRRLKKTRGYMQSLYKVASKQPRRLQRKRLARKEYKDY